MPVVVRCFEPRKNSPRKEPEPCGGFAGIVPWPYEVVAIRSHSSEADPRNHVNVCRKCGRLYEIRPKASAPEAA